MRFWWDLLLTTPVGILFVPIILYVGSRIISTAFFDAKRRHHQHVIRDLEQETSNDPTDQPEARKD